MARRSTPERLDEARRAATRNRLMGEQRTTEETADAWIAAWEAQAAEDGLERGSAYWDAGWQWIAEQRRSRVRPYRLEPGPRLGACPIVDPRHFLLHGSRCS